MIDLTAAEIFPALYPAFKNNNVYTAAGVISGTVVPGYQERTVTVNLPAAPDMVDVLFTGQSDVFFGIDPRPAGTWFHEGSVWVRGDNAGAGYVNYGIPFKMSARIVGATLIVVASFVWTATPTLTLTDTPFNVKLLDYSVL